MPAIETKGLTKIYDKIPVVDSLSLSVKQGAVFALLGPNGSGKSTAVKMLCGLLKPSSGEARIMDHPIPFEDVEIKKQIGVLPESLALFDGLSVWEHVFLTGEVYGLSKTDTEYRGEQLLKHLDLWEKRNTRVEQCSFGMKKKCSLAMALIHNPQVIFLDEPFEGVDPLASRNIRETIKHAASKDCTFFITSHSLEVIEQIADSFAIVSGGKLVYQATIKSLAADNKKLEDVYFEHVKEDVSGDLAWLGR